ncbi:cyclodeaminase/cyclohydrolase family protein [Halomonas aquamarina]|uniref:Cyclodeaminase/cyclohydrolase family protein n=1 Tax=Vreelandella aquamarina TaxID=77097 RepID=A0ACC5VXA7_9GAMM|nr:cyclodeaminase/cyclohydrolase family protein [Halomonas aquamarina]MBZ5488505.1 cyclodeaminase/cyclohydrolase family protein [Halomonas aquamarina]
MQDAKEHSPVWEQRLDHFRDSLAHRPMPGCGAAASVTAALGMALMLKGVHLSQQHETSEARRVLIDEGERLKAQLAPLADKDIAAFEGLMEAFQMPHGNEHEENARRRAIQQAAATAVDVPLTTARLCREALALGERAGEYSERQFASDAQAGCELLVAALRSVLLNVEANIDSLGSDAEKRHAQAAHDELKKQVGASARQDAV